MASRSSNTTVNHEEIKNWAESRRGHPAQVKGTGSESDAGLLRIDFEEKDADPRLQEISWDEFFKKFDEKDLAFLYQDRTSAGRESRFFKLINRDGQNFQHSRTERSQRSEQSQQQPQNQQANQNLLKALNEIFESDIKTIQSYAKALSLVQDEKLKNELSELCDEHDRHLMLIENFIYALGGQPEKNALEENRQSTHH